MRCISIKIYGKVQNVGFRYYTRKTGQSLNLNGFVKNIKDGSVYTEAEGEDENIESFIEFCKKGPEWSRVDSIEIQDIPEQNFTEFSIK